MALTSLIIRAEGVLAGVEHLHLRAFERVFTEAGFNWTADPEAFAASRSQGGLRDRMAYFVKSQLRGRPETDDISALIAAMHRRACKLFSLALTERAFEARPMTRDLVATAASEGITIAILSSLRETDTATLIKSCLGDASRHVSQVWSEPDSHCQNDDRHDALYARAAEDVRFPPAQTLVIESAADGVKAARASGYRVLTIRDPSCPQSMAETRFDVAFDDLSMLLGRDKQRRLDPLTADERALLISVLNRCHAGNNDLTSQMDGTIAMRISDILTSKGSTVRTIEPEATVRAFAHALKSAGVGAMVVQGADGKVVGIISERDLARGLADFGTELPRMPVSELMTRNVITCKPTDSVSSVARLMTQRRIRHVPVVVDEKLIGMVSTGDALKHRLDEAQLEANVMRDYAIARK